MPIPKTMAAAVVEQFCGPLVIRELPVPRPGPGQALVEIRASGVCHTDLHAANGDWPVRPHLPSPLAMRERVSWSRWVPALRI